MLFRPIVAIAFLLFASNLWAGSEPNLVLLDADFNDKALNVLIGTGGAVVGEPVALSSGLQAVVTPVPLPTPSLRLGQSSTGSARFAEFEFLGGEEVGTGPLSIFMLLKPAALDRYLVYLRETTGASKNFANLVLMNDGGIALSDANAGVLLGATYSPGQNLAFEFRYDLDAGTYDLLLNNTLLVDDRAHGVVGGGIGSIYIGLDTTTTSQIFLDELSVTRPDRIHGDGFE
ncbi:MAG TPA: hypothetical protein VN581_08950 [Patescibacteria group bacterium]|nr:hypothetical protein [Patescibacteria group bacterium]